ncbi:MAG: antitoxin family protein [Nitrospirae bacterium]|nr:antitoxin family protein [Nitrospirota bacterium]
MPKTVEAIFEEGVFKPISRVDISEHKKVTLIIEDKSEEPSDILSLASMVYNGLSSEDIDAVEKIAFDRSRFSRNSN